MFLYVMCVLQPKVYGHESCGAGVCVLVVDLVRRYGSMGLATLELSNCYVM